MTVFNDLNGDGLQGPGEEGIAGVELRLMKKRSKNSRAWTFLRNEVVTTDENGVATFLNVPQKLRLKVKVVSPPDGGIPTKRNVGNDEANDSDLGRDGFSHQFTAQADENGEHTSIDFGYRLPGIVKVRVLYDVNGSVVGARRFQPHEYLDHSIDPDLGMSGSKPLYIVMELGGDATRATSFEFTFL